MTVTEQSRREVVTTEDPPQLLFPEANRRRRRRRLAVVLIALILVGGIIAALAMLPVGSSTRRNQPSTLPSLPNAAPALVEGISRVAWSDYEGQLHIGDLNGLSQSVVTQTDADPTASLLALDGGIFWARSLLPTPNQTVDPVANRTVQRYDVATGAVTTLGPGNQVFAAPDRRTVFVATGNGQLVEYTSLGLPTGRRLQIPAGWFLADASLLGDPNPVVANGILVESLPVQISKAPLTFAIWDPTTGHVRKIGKVWKVIDTFTKPGAHSSLIAWTPASCERVTNCPIDITDSATLLTRSVISPLGHGFEWGGAFSPDGSVLAAFVPGRSTLSPAAELVLITGPGEVHVVRGTTINNGDSLAWAAWYPNSKYLIVGGVGSPDGVQNDNHYLVNASTRTATAFRFLANGQTDINFSVTVLP